MAGSAPVEKGAGVGARATKSGRVEPPTTQGVVAGSARATEDARAGARATTSGRVGAPTVKDNKSDKVTSAPKAEASSRDADSTAEDKVPQAFDVFTGEPKVGEVLTPLPTVAELLELEELSYVEFMDSLKAGELAEMELLRSEGSSLELNSSSVMDPEVLEDERTSKRFKLPEPVHQGLSPPLVQVLVAIRPISGTGFRTPSLHFGDFRHVGPPAHPTITQPFLWVRVGRAATPMGVVARPRDCLSPA
ncbi:hypothetical protein PF003_g16059 [Phytophthora fragariae]|nr:hypothetical protein PF003_g16059 [Phytophthora fragariae]